MADTDTKSIADRRHELKNRQWDLALEMRGVSAALKSKKWDLEMIVESHEELVKKVECEISELEDAASKLLEEDDAIDDELDLLKEVGN